LIALEGKDRKLKVLPSYSGYTPKPVGENHASIPWFNAMRYLG